MEKSSIKWVRQIGSPINKYRAEDTKEFRGVGVYSPSGKFGFRVHHPYDKNITLFVDSEYGIKARIARADRYAYEWRNVSLEELKHLTKNLELVGKLTKARYVSLSRKRKPESIEYKRILKIIKNCKKILDARWKTLPPGLKPS